MNETLTNEERKLLQERYAAVPAELRSVLTNKNYSATIEGIGVAHELTPKQTAMLENEVSFVLLTITDHSELVNNIRESLEISEEKAEKIEFDVSSTLLGSIIPLLQYIESETDATEARGMEESIPEKQNNDPSITVRNVAKPDPVPSLRERLHLKPEGAEHPPQEEESGEKTNDAKPMREQELFSTLSVQRTMAEDVKKAKEIAQNVKENPPVPQKPTQKEKASDSLESQSNIPRYAKPLTDTPHYDEKP